MFSSCIPEDTLVKKDYTVRLLNDLLGLTTYFVVKKQSLIFVFQWIDLWHCIVIFKAKI